MKLEEMLIGKNVSAKGYFLLQAIRDNFLLDIVGVAVQRQFPFIFKSATDIKVGYDELILENLINADYEKGDIKNISINKDIFKEALKVDKPVRQKRDKKEVKEETDEDRIIKAIVKHYNSYEHLPRPSSLTDLVKTRLKAKLEIFSPEQINEAIDYVSTQDWVEKRAGDSFMNLSWIIFRIDDFMVGGKYRGNKQQEIQKKTNSYISDKDEVIVF